MIPIRGGTTEDENRALAKAITSFLNRRDTEDYSALTDFLVAYPQSRWRSALQLNLGMMYASACYYGRAFKAFIDAWDLAKGEAAGPGKALADRIVGELAELYGSLGCADALGPVLEEIKGRAILGSARQKVVGAKDRLGFMYNHPDHAYNCGPLALDALWRSKRKTRDHLEMLFDPEEGVVGRSLTQLADLAVKAGIPMVGVKRPSGAEFPVPCLVHWKAQHFDALVEKHGNHYLLRNPALSHDIWVSQAALEEETSGHILVPPSQVPAGWKKLSAEDGQGVWGGCHTGTVNPDNTDECQKSTSPGCGGAPMASYTIQLATVSLHLSDTPVSYVPARGPAISFRVNYNHREATQPVVTITFSNFGRLWAFNWLSYVNDHTAADASNFPNIYELGGGTKQFSFPTSTSTVSAANKSDGSFLQRIIIGGTVTRYDRIFSDGSKLVYNVATATSGTNSRMVFLKEIHDPQDNVVMLSYDAQFRITGITDALGQVTTFSYNLPSDACKITRVTDPFGRSAQFGYNTAGQLTSITDPVGIVSQFTYSSPGDFISKLTTPYGDTTFAFGESGSYETTIRWLEATDSLGGKERVEYHQDDLRDNQNQYIIPDYDPTLSASANAALAVKRSNMDSQPSGLMIANDRVSARNTFHWDKKAMMTAPGDYTKAHLYHWLHDDLTSQITDVLESEKPALGSRIWYNYPNQGNPYFEIGSSANVIRAGRVVDAQNTLQLQQFDYNAQGNRTLSIDPLGRKTVYVYDANGIDVLEIRNQSGALNELLASFTYTDTTHHLVQTATSAAGQAVSFTYNASRQRLTQTVTRNALPETTSWAYFANGLRQSITGPVAGATVNFTYDVVGRVKTVTDSDNYTVTYDYDNIDRVTKVTYPDGTYEQTLYALLDAEWMRDRLGRWTHVFHDAVRRVSGVTDAARRTMAYDWCVCGALHGLKDGEGHETTFEYDLEKRVTKKTYADGKTLQYQYDPYRGLRTQRVGGRNQAANYAYNLDDSLQQITYTDAATGQPLNPPTPAVSYAYDAAYPRLASMTDGTGVTQVGYYPVAAGTLGAGRLATVDGPLANDTITYTYDELGRRTGSAVNAVPDGVTFDALGRVTAASNPLGTFNYAYVNATGRLNTITYPNLQTTSFGWHPNTVNDGTGNVDQRLKYILNQLPGGATASRFDYTYDAAGQLASWTQQPGAAATTRDEYVNDGVGELLSATRKDAASGTAQKQWQYAYDKAGNRTLEQVNTTVSAVAGAVHNNVNQVTARNGGGAMVFEGTVSKPSRVTVGGTNGVGGQAAVLAADNSFRAALNVSPGPQSIEIRAVDANGNVTTNHAQVTVTAGTAGQSFNYDDDGNMTGDGTSTYGWDAENRLVKVTVGGNVHEFSYNGAGLRASRKLNGTVTKQWVWDGTTLREERDAANNVTKRYYAQGVVLGATAAATDKVTYTRDHLGSIREMVDGTGALRARYDYDAWGQRTKTTGALDADMGFTGHYTDDTLGLVAAPFRFYRPDLGRWLSRDPIEEEGGINLYGYVGNNPLFWVDPLGLDLDVYVDRDYADRRAPANYKVVENGKTLYNGRCNQNPFFAGDASQGVRAGDYDLLKKGDSWGGGIYPNDQPAITGSGKDLKPGQPNSSYKAPALIHKEGPRGSPDSLACVTVSPDAEKITKDALGRNPDSSRIHITHPKPTSPTVRRALWPQGRRN